MQNKNKAQNSGANIIGEVYHRPWGTYQTLALEEGYQVKIITVNSGGQLSLQKHKQRSEHWVIVKGQPTITVGDETKTYNVNGKVYIPTGITHRLENFTSEPAVIIEVQI